MAGSEKDFGGIVQGISDAIKEGMATGFTDKKRRSLEQAAEQEQAPARAIPERAVQSTPKPFGKFATQKRK